MQRWQLRLPVALALAGASLIACAPKGAGVPAASGTVTRPTSNSDLVVSGIDVNLRFAGIVTKFDGHTGVGCVKGPANQTGCGYFLVPNSDTVRVGDAVEAVVGTAPTEDNNQWIARRVVLINGFIVHG